MADKEWDLFLMPYHQAVQELIVKFENVLLEYRSSGKYSPIEQVQGRVKSVESIQEKMQKNNIDIHDLEDRMSDIAGIRIICQFVEDIDTVVDMIRERKDMEITEETNYVSHKKESGYRSYHIIINYPVFTVRGTKVVRCEIQIRTLGMNFWSTIEHSLSYKYKGKLPSDVKVRLQNASEAAFEMDKEMSAIRSEIVDAQDHYMMRISSHHSPANR